MQPLTPPRLKNQPRSSVPYTPKTPFGKKSDKSSSSVLSPPQTSSNTLLTPGPTPRHSSRKRKELGDAINIVPSSGTQRTLFPPTPSTIGSGRSKVNHILISPLRKSEDEDVTSTFSTKRKLKFELDEEDDEDEKVESIGQKTPGAQLITEKLINQWNNEIPVDESDGEEFITRKPLVNPFMTKSSGPAIKRNLPKQTEITLINKKGEKIIRKLTEEESNYKPKNLFGSLVKETNKIDVYNDNDN